MKALQTISGSLLFAALAGAAAGLLRHRETVQRKVEDKVFEDCALCTFEGEGGLVLN